MKLKIKSNSTQKVEKPKLLLIILVQYLKDSMLLQVLLMLCIIHLILVAEMLQNLWALVRIPQILLQGTALLSQDKKDPLQDQLFKNMSILSMEKPEYRLVQQNVTPDVLIVALEMFVLLVKVLKLEKILDNVTVKMDTMKLEILIA